MDKVELLKKEYSKLYKRYQEMEDEFQNIQSNKDDNIQKNELKNIDHFESEHNLENKRLIEEVMPAMRSDNKELIYMIKDHKEQIEKYKADNEKLLIAIDQYKKENILLEKKLSNDDNYKIELEEAIVETEKERLEIKEEIFKLKSELKAEVDYWQERSTGLSQKRDEIDSLNKFINALSKEIHEYKLELIKKDDELNKLRQNKVDLEENVLGQDIKREITEIKELIKLDNK